jgi:hypothetical protein
MYHVHVQYYIVGYYVLEGKMSSESSIPSSRRTNKNGLNATLQGFITPGRAAQRQ